MNYNSHINSLFPHCQVHKIYGTAGAGKTTFLIDELNELFKNDVQPERIAFMSFTNKAVDELVDRIIEKFTQFKRKQFKHFKTIHSMCYSSLGKKEHTVISKYELNKLAMKLGMQVSSSKNIEDGYGTRKGDIVLNLESLARLRMVTLKEQWEESCIEDCPFFMVKEWRAKLIEYKKENNLIDFSDMLEMYDGFLDVDYIFIDEAQDLSPLQWDVVNKISLNCKKTYIAGDDDQSIFNWAGAEIDYLLHIKTDEETILSKSYRLPSNIYHLSRRILKRIKNRKPKECDPIEKEGNIKYVFKYESIDMENGEDFLILVRNRWQIRNIKLHLENKGIPFLLFEKNMLDTPETKAIVAWNKSRKKKAIKTREDFNSIKRFSSIVKDFGKKEDLPKDFFEKEWFKILNLIDKSKSLYIRRVLKNGYKLSYIPKIKISTIHQAKGGEADNVVIFTDVSYTVWKNLNSDFEHKVWYVAVTRSKKNLFIIKEQSNKYYKI